MTTQTKRGALVVGASLAALTAGWYIYRWYQKQEHDEQLESEELAQRFDEEMKAMSKPKRSHRNTNGRHKPAKT